MARNLIKEALSATTETRQIEFKQFFDPENPRDWCEVLKDIFALANSGGGVVVFGVDNSGKPVAQDLVALSKLDPAKLGDKIEGYTGVQFDDFQLQTHKKAWQMVVTLTVGEAETPLVPRRPGTYALPNQKNQERAFSVGVVYIRRRGKSTPAMTADIRKLIDRRVAMERRILLRDVRRVASAPKGAKVELIVPQIEPKTVLPTKGIPKVPRESSVPIRATISPDAVPIRLTSDPNASAFRLYDPDQTHPYRMKELLENVNRRLEDIAVTLSPYDIHAIDSAHHVLDRLDFSYKPRYGTRKYSDEFAKWLVNHLRKDRNFHILARSRLRRLRRQNKIEHNNQILITARRTDAYHPIPK